MDSSDRDRISESKETFGKYLVKYAIHRGKVIAASQSAMYKCKSYAWYGLYIINNHYN